MRGRRPRPQRPQVNLPEPPLPHPPAEKVENWRSTLVERQCGHAGCRSASCIRRSNSKLLPHLRQWYSYKGIFNKCVLTNSITEILVAR
jgi:hypothetical protein